MNQMSLLKNIIITFVILLNSSLSRDHKFINEVSGKYKTKDIYLHKCYKTDEPVITATTIKVPDEPIITATTIKTTVESATTDQTAKNENLDAEGRVSNSTRTILYILLGIFALILIAALVYCIVIRKSKKNEIKDP
uniref:Glycophorin-A n=1 Tax=Schistosoma mansoni TaxID=6183 RepID=A0A5K4FAS9_SCHMA